MEKRLKTLQELLYSDHLRNEFKENGNIKKTRTKRIKRGKSKKGKRKTNKRRINRS